MGEYGHGPEDHAWYAGQLAPGARLEVWVDAERTERVRAINDLHGEPYPDGIVVCDELGRYRFDTVGEFQDLWISPLGSARAYRIQRSDVGQRLGTVETSLSTVRGQVGSLSERLETTAPLAAAAHQAATGLQDSIGRANGLAPLDDGGVVPATHLPDAGAGTTGYIDVLDHGATGDGEEDDTAPINEALAEASHRPGSTVYFPPAHRFRITGPLYVQEGTRVLAHGATIRRDGYGWMLVNRDPLVTPTAPGYEGHGNISVEGGLWDAGGSHVAEGHANTFSIGHGRNLVFRDLTIRDVPGNHAIEVNACENVLIERCRFEGFSRTAGQRDFSEAVQLDLMKGSSYFGAFGPYDHTPCRNVTIRGCWFGGSPVPGGTQRPVQPWARGVGSHAATIGRWHTNVIITENVFEETSQWAVGAYTWREFTITNNIMHRCGAGVWVRSVETSRAADTRDVDGNQTNRSQDCGNGLVSGNIYRDGGDYAPAVRLEGEETGRVVRVAVTDNIVRGTGTGQTGVRGVYTVRCRLEGNTIQGSAGTGVSILNAEDLIIADNTLDRAGGAGVTVDQRPGGEHVTISNNSIADPADNGVWLLGGRHYLMEGNYVVGASRGSNNANQGMRLVDVQGATLVGNRIRPRTGATSNPAWALSINAGCRDIRRSANDWTGGGTTGDVDDAHPQWTTPTLGNGWGAFTGTGTWQHVRYRRTMDGRVLMEGLIAGGTEGQAAFTLPAALRPAVDRAFACLSSSTSPPTVSRVVVNTSGQVIPQGHVGNFVSLELSFEAREA